MITNVIKTGSAIALGMFILGSASRGYAEPAGSDPSADRQLAAAAKCEQKAVTIQASIDGLLKLKADNLRQWMLRKSPMNRDIAAADRKYNAEIAALRDSQGKCVELAHYYKLQALEVQTAGLNASGSATD